MLTLLFSAMNLDNNRVTAHVYCSMLTPANKLPFNMYLKSEQLKWPSRLQNLQY